MKLTVIAAAALVSAAPALAGTSFFIDFEKTWTYAENIGEYYASQGVSFTNLAGLSNTEPDPYFSNAPSPMGAAFVPDTNGLTSYMNVAAGVEHGLSFYYASEQVKVGAIKAYSGLNGTGAMLGSFDFAITTGPSYDNWQKGTLSFTGTARSFDLYGTRLPEELGAAGLDNISAVPEPEAFALLLAGLGLVGASVRRQRKQPI